MHQRAGHEPLAKFTPSADRLSIVTTPWRALAKMMTLENAPKRGSFHDRALRKTFGTQVAF